MKFDRVRYELANCDRVIRFTVFEGLLSSRICHPVEFVIPNEVRDLQLNREKRYYVYIMASRSLTLYTGVTNSLYQRVLQHKCGEIEGFTKKYHINRLVYYESLQYIGNAIARERQIKAWTRAKRLALIKSMNPTWQDLAEDWGKPIEPLKLQIPHFVRDDKA